MEAAFASQNGPLTDMTAEAGERVGRLQLFVGAIASYKNPHSRRDFDLNDPTEAVEIILLAKRHPGAGHRVPVAALSGEQFRRSGGGYARRWRSLHRVSLRYGCRGTFRSAMPPWWCR
jgi:hypothetical protein